MLIDIIMWIVAAIIVLCLIGAMATCGGPEEATTAVTTVSALLMLA